MRDLALQPPDTSYLHCPYSCHLTWQHGSLPLTVLTHKITWPSDLVLLRNHLRKKTIISPLPQCLSPLNLARWWLTLSGSYSQSPTTLRSGFLVRSRNKLKPLYLHYDSAVPMTTKLDRMVTPTHNVSRFFGHMMLKDRMTD